MHGALYQNCEYYDNFSSSSSFSFFLFYRKGTMITSVPKHLLTILEHYFLSYDVNTTPILPHVEHIFWSFSYLMKPKAFPMNVNESFSCQAFGQDNLYTNSQKATLTSIIGFNVHLQYFSNSFAYLHPILSIHTHNWKII